MHNFYVAQNYIDFLIYAGFLQRLSIFFLLEVVDVVNLQGVESKI